MATPMQVQKAYADYSAAMAAGDTARATQISTWMSANPVYVTEVRTNHTFHLLMTVFTFGMWAPVWMAVALVHAARK